MTRKDQQSPGKGGGAVVPSTREGIRRAQEILRSYIPEGRLLSEELIEERRLLGCLQAAKAQLARREGIPREEAPEEDPGRDRRTGTSRRG